eukprot:scaffold29251_cov155-Isochrysis_galbana.AAC.2
MKLLMGGAVRKIAQAAPLAHASSCPQIITPLLEFARRRRCCSLGSGMVEPPSPGNHDSHPETMTA